jgi:hypothetical protein
MFDVVESIRHGPLEGSSGVFKNKRYFPISERPLREMKVFLCWSAGRMSIWLYLEKPSIKEKMVMPVQLSIIWSMKGVG